MVMLTALKALSVLFVLVVLAADQARGRHHQPDCPSFSCGPLRNVSSPFRQASDPPSCGYQSYELVCSDNKATIRIYNATYDVSAINYIDRTFWVVDADLDLYNSCPLPHWNRPPDPPSPYHDMDVELAPLVYSMACFVECSQEVKDNGRYKYNMPVACLSSNNSFVYMLTGLGSVYMEYLEPSCGYLAMTPWPWHSGASGNASYADVVKSMRIGFAVQFPFRFCGWGGMGMECLMVSFRSYCRKYHGEAVTTYVMDIIQGILEVVGHFLVCPDAEDGYSYSARKVVCYTRVLMWIVALFRFVLAALVLYIFLAYKYWKTRIIIDAVEKFLQMQLMLSPTRYAYTDLVAVTRHFRYKLGQGGYGSVFKGVLLPGDVHVAIKMLDGKSNCDGEDFISEVSTIGRIHHVNVVRLVGFCSEEMRRALVYEYMPQGSLDKYIFSAEKNFSWDKLTEIALGIARGID